MIAINWLLRLVAVYFLVQGLIYITNQKTEYLKNQDTPSNVITMAEREKHLQCLAKNIYFEAAQEPFEGKVAIAQVTINRSNSGKFPSDICDVVFQKTKFADKIVCQFTWYCERGPKIPDKNAAYIESQEVAKRVLLENFRLPSLHHAMYYHADYVNPNWKLPRITKIGRHIFYGEKT